MVMVCVPPNIVSKTQATTKHVESLLLPYLDVGSTPTGSTNFASRRGAKKAYKELSSLLEIFLVGFFICYEVARGKVCEAPLSESRYRETGSLYRNFLPP